MVWTELAFEIWRMRQAGAEVRYYLGLPAGHPERTKWLRSSSSTEIPKMKGYRGRSKAQIQKLIRKETFGGRFKCRNCDLRFKTRKARRHHEKYSHRHVGRVRAKQPLILFGMELEDRVEIPDVAKQSQPYPFNPPRKRNNTRSNKP